MIRRDLANVYRRFTRRHQAVESLPPVDALLSLSEGEAGADTERMLADAGRFGLHADLLRFARDLRPESARLGVQLERAFDRRAASDGHRRERRTAQAPRRGLLRGASAIAAGLIVAVAVWTLRHDHAPDAADLGKVAKPDRIFAALDEGRAPSTRGDVIFRGGFRRDHIFRSEFSGG